jgi:hypothetical protein
MVENLPRHNQLVRGGAADEVSDARANGLRRSNDGGGLRRLELRAFDCREPCLETIRIDRRGNRSKLPPTQSQEQLLVGSEEPLSFVV